MFIFDFDINGFRMLGVWVALAICALGRASDISVNYECTTYHSVCVPYSKCGYKGDVSLQWCDSKKSKVCCPKSSEKGYDASFNKYVKNYDYDRQSSYDRLDKNNGKRDYRRKEYEGHTLYPKKDHRRYDYYEDGYSGPYRLSQEAKRILQSYDEKECGIRKSFHTKISTGHDADLGVAKYGEFPWQVALLTKLNVKDGYYARAYKYICGGSVISPVLVLTAAHCVKGIKVSDLKVKLGDWNLKGSQGEVFPTVERRVRKIILHDYYDSSTFAHDIAILVLSRPVNLRKTPHVAPVCLPNKHTKFDEYSKCYIVGWGNDVYKPNYGSNILKVASVSMLKEDCRHKLKKSIPSLSNTFYKDDISCITGSHGKDACIGDGGGAVVCPLSNVEAPICKGRGYSCRDEHYFVAGVISWGSDSCGQEDSVTAITDLTAHAEWVSEKALPYGGVHYTNDYYDDVIDYRYDDDYEDYYYDDIYEDYRYDDYDRKYYDYRRRDYDHGRKYHDYADESRKYSHYGYGDQYDDDYEKYGKGDHRYYDGDYSDEYDNYRGEFGRRHYDANDDYYGKDRFYGYDGGHDKVYRHKDTSYDSNYRD